MDTEVRNKKNVKRKKNKGFPYKSRIAKRDTEDLKIKKDSI